MCFIFNSIKNYRWCIITPFSTNGNVDSEKMRNFPIVSCDSNVSPTVSKAHTLYFTLALKLLEESIVKRSFYHPVLLECLVTHPVGHPYALLGCPSCKN